MINQVSKSIDKWDDVHSMCFIWARWSGATTTLKYIAKKYSSKYLIVYIGRNQRAFKLFKNDVQNVIDLRQYIASLRMVKNQPKIIILFDDSSIANTKFIREIIQFEHNNVKAIFCINAWSSGSFTVTTDEQIIDKLPRLCDKRFYFYPTDLQKKVDKRIKQILKF